MKIVLPSDSVPVTDRALGVGHGLFETVLVVQGIPVLLAQHLHRLEKGAKALHINIELDKLKLELDKFLKSVDRSDFVVKLILTSGDGGRGYTINQGSESRLILQDFPAPTLSDKLWSSGLRLRVCDHRLPHNPALAGYKHINRLDQIIARAEWDSDEFDDAIVLDQNDNVIEAISSNLFMAIGGKLYTPSLQNCGVAGTMRSYLMDNLESIFAMPVIETELNIQHLEEVDALFMANSVRGIRPIGSVAKVRDCIPIDAVRKIAVAVHAVLGLRHLMPN